MSLTVVLYNTISLIAVACCWGLTNPFIKLGSKGLEDIKAHRKEWYYQTYEELKFLFTNWKYVLPLLINLSGSAVYYYTLGQADLSLAVPITNSLTLIFTLLGGKLLGENINFKDIWFGMLLVIVGVTLCVLSK
ncbi:transmembrane protein [Neoconidiobolus thromboides FSU 785]|nr:transmembrane protein [Neoconidiobolus thromboides FSU 785]